MEELSHVNDKGKARMVDVSSKPNQIRIAEAKGKIFLQRETLNKIKENELKKGDVLAVARLAGIQATKTTSLLIPLCHTLLLSHVNIDFEIIENYIEASCITKCTGPTGVEMEALIGVSIALLTIYDMCKAIDKTMQISDIRLISKSKT